MIGWRRARSPGGSASAARRFGLGRPASARLSEGPVARGRQGHVWRLRADGGLWAVKVPFQPSNEDSVRPAAAFQEAACTAGVPAPRVVRTVEGDVLATVSGHQIRLYEWVDLLPSSLDLDPATVGRVAATIHQVVPPLRSEAPVDPWYYEPVGAEGWDRLVRKLFNAGAPFAADLAALRDELVALESWLEPPAGITMCHRDLWADNFLPTPDGGVCVIDWENSGAGDPCHELACLLFEFARCDAGRARERGGATAPSRPRGSASCSPIHTAGTDFGACLTPYGRVERVAQVLQRVEGQ